MKRWLHWLIVRPWPVWALLAVVVAVLYGGDWTLTADGPTFNKVTGAVLQAVGAFLVLASIDGNIGLFAGRGIVAMATGWAHDYPKALRRIVLAASGSCQANSSAGAAISIKPSTIDGRVAELERVILELRTIISTRHSEVTQLVERARAEAGEANSRTAINLRDLETKLVTSAVGGVEIQFFGVGLALIGSALSVFS